MKYLYIFISTFIIYPTSWCQVKSSGIFNYTQLKPSTYYYFDSLKAISGAVQAMSGDNPEDVLLIKAFKAERSTIGYNYFKGYHIKSGTTIYFDYSDIIGDAPTLFTKIYNYSDSITNKLDSVPYLIEKNANLEKKKDSLERIIKIEKEIKYVTNQGLAIKSWEVSSTEYSDFNGIYISVINLSKKIIKYIWVNAQAYNAVNDPIKPFSGPGLIGTMKGIGPIEQYDEGAYDFDNIWYSRVLDHCKLKSIKVQYMDGTFKTYLNPQSLELSEETLHYLQSKSE